MSNWEILWSSRDVFWQGFGNTVTIFVISAIAAFLLGSLLVFIMEGTGIGLTITHQLVKQMHATLTVESQLEKGSLFIVTLPVAPRIA